jgi:DNA-binding SARP family transcriptional activator
MAITMLFPAKAAAPLAAHLGVRQPSLDRAADGALTLVTAPAGYLLADSLAAAITERGRSIIWLRLGPEDDDPATCLVSLIASARRLNPEIGAVTLAQMRRQPGPTAGWPPLFATLARELADALPTSTVVVLEHIHHLYDQHLTLRLLGHHLLPGLPSDLTCILTAHHRLPAAALPPQTAQCGVNELRLDARAALTLAHHTEADLPEKCVRRATDLTQGRVGALVGLCAACDLLGPTFIQRIVERAANAGDLLTRLTRAWLAVADTNSLRALALALRLDYTHPALVQATLGDGVPPAGPWSQPLAEGWTRVRRMWDAPLRAALRPGAGLNRDDLHHAADYLASQGATEKAVPLYLELGDDASAAQMIAGEASTLLDRGQWQTLEGWLTQLPKSALNAWPRLIYTQGEIATAQGQTEAARRAFALAAELFTARHEADGACLSLLAESALAAWSGDRAHAQVQALTASLVAEAAGLNGHRSWATWQLGCFAAAAGDLDSAITYFDQAAALASTTGDALMAEGLRRGEALARQWRDVRRQRGFHHQAYLVAERAERMAAERLRQLLGSPSESLDALLGAHGWSGTPLMLKLPAPASPPALPAAPSLTHLWDSLIGWLGLRRPPMPKTTEPERPNHLPSEEPQITPTVVNLPAPPAADSLVVDDAPPVGETMPQPGDAVASSPPIETKPTPPRRSAKPSPAAPTLTAHLLGTFRVTVNDCPIEKWPTGKGQAVFKYLLTHRDRPTPRDVLTETFWPEAEPEAARNRINVAVHSLRQALKSVTAVAVIVYEAGAYGLNPDLRLWLDLEEFERRVQAGRRLEATGQLKAAIAEYELAENLYQGDFLEADRYEEWAIARREGLRDNYFIVLDHLSRYYLEKEKYTVCILLCQKILAKDDCREDAHRRLMRCYAQQGERNLALRQYQLCVEALARVMDVSPTQETTALYHQIRKKGEAV